MEIVLVQGRPETVELLWWALQGQPGLGSLKGAFSDDDGARRGRIGS